MTDSHRTGTENTLFHILIAFQAGEIPSLPLVDDETEAQ